MTPVVADADTLFGAPTRGLLIHLDYQGLIRLHWSPWILDELSRALVDTGRKPDAESARKRPDPFLLERIKEALAAVATAFASLRATLRSAPTPEMLLERMAADGQALTAAALHDAWRQGAVRL